MLTKRTNILFEENIFKSLAFLAEKKGTSVGNLVRNAIAKVYFAQIHPKKADAYNQIITLRKNIKKINSSDIKQFIEYGRKI